MTVTLQISGKAGTSGTTIVPGTGAPDVTKGINGDYWLDLTVGAVSLYGPKAGGAWPTTGILLSGAVGSRGNTIIQASGVPDASLGIAGDYAVDPAASIIYGPKTASWPAGVALKGKDGVLPIGSLTAWASGAAYSATAPASAVSYLGTSYVCSSSHTAGVAFDVTKWTILALKGDTGPVSLAPPVGWTQNTQFNATAPASLVTYKGSSYVCSVTHQSGSAFDVTKFTVLAEKGDRGDPFTLPAQWNSNVQYNSSAPISLVYYSGSTYACIIDHVSGGTFNSLNWQIIASGSDLIAIQAIATEVAASASLAQGWASTPDNTDVPGAPAGGRSALHWSDQAKAWAQTPDGTDVPNAPSGSRSARAYADLAQGWANTPENTDVPNEPTGSRSAFHFMSKAAEVLASIQALITAGGLLAYGVAQSLTGAQQAQAISNLGLGPMLADGQCKLVMTSASVITLAPFNGGNLVINGTQQQVTSPALQASTLNGSTGYYIYAAMSGSAMALEASTTTHVTDTNGREIKQGDATRRLVGWVYLNNSGQFQQGGAFNGVYSYFNRGELLTVIDGQGTAGSSSYAAVSGFTFFAWKGDLLRFRLKGYCQPNSASALARGAISIDGSVYGRESDYQSYTANSIGDMNTSFDRSDLSEGIHSCNSVAAVSAGNSAFNFGLSLATRG